MERILAGFQGPSKVLLRYFRWNHGKVGEWSIFGQKEGMWILKNYLAQFLHLLLIVDLISEKKFWPQFNENSLEIAVASTKDFLSHSCNTGS